MVDIAKLTAQTEFRKDGSKNIKSYKISLAKVATEEVAGFDKETELEITYEKDKITLTRKK